MGEMKVTEQDVFDAQAIKRLYPTAKKVTRIHSNSTWDSGLFVCLCGQEIIQIPNYMFPGLNDFYSPEPEREIIEIECLTNDNIGKTFITWGDKTFKYLDYIVNIDLHFCTAKTLDGQTVFRTDCNHQPSIEEAKSAVDNYIRRRIEYYIMHEPEEATDEIH